MTTQAQCFDRAPSAALVPNTNISAPAPPVSLGLHVHGHAVGSPLPGSRPSTATLTFAPAAVISSSMIMFREAGRRILRRDARRIDLFQIGTTTLGLNSLPIMKRSLTLFPVSYFLCLSISDVLLDAVVATTNVVTTRGRDKRPRTPTAPAQEDSGQRSTSASARPRIHSLSSFERKSSSQRKRSRHSR